MRALVVGFASALLVAAVAYATRRRRIKPPAYKWHRTGLWLPNADPDATNLSASDLMKDTTGCLGRVVWPAAEILCDFLLKCDSEWLSTSVDRAIELGSGVGAAGLLAARCGLRSVTLTDYHPLVLDALRETIVVNGLENRCTVAALDWSESGADNGERWPLVLGADLTWTTRGAIDLAKAVRRVLAPDGVFIYAHVERKAVYKGAGGTIRTESFDSALQSLLVELLSDGTIECRELERRVFDGDDETVLLLAFGGASALERFAEAGQRQFVYVK